MRNLPLLLISTIVVLATARGILSAAPNEVRQSPSVPEPRIVDCRLGFENHYKIGYWTPLRVEVTGVSKLEEPRIEVSTVDNDGVETKFRAAIASDQPTSAHLLYIKVGRLDAAIYVSLVGGGKEIDRQSLQPNATGTQEPTFDALPAVSELLVSLGGDGSGLTDAVADRDAEGTQLVRRVVEIDEIAALPDEWFGYEAVDLVVLSTSDVKLCRALAADTKRFAALRRWVELGGRVVVTAGGGSADELLGDGSALAVLLPGKLAEIVRTSEMTSIEHYADTTEPIARPGSRAELQIPKLIDVRGAIDSYLGPRPTALPIVVRGPLGLGEAAFVGLALSESPLAEWNGRDDFWRALLRPYLANGEAISDSPTLGTLGYNDLSGALRQRLGRSFANVTSVPFALVAVSAIAYMLLVGPANYWLAHRRGARPGLAWVVFPLLVLMTSAGAFWYGRQTKGATAQVNQMELVDYDITTGQARGTYWGAMYSPESEQFDLRLNVDSPGNISNATESADALPESRILLSWWGLPGVGVGGMQASGLNLATIDVSYRFSRELDALEGVPILTAATKSLTARWTAPVEQLIRSELTDDDGMLTGTLANDSGRKLSNPRLLYGTWAYRLGDLADGEQIDIGQHLNPIKIQTLVTQMARGGAPTSYTDRGRFLAERATTDEIVSLMMFYRAAGGGRFADLPSRYQSYCDLSRLVELRRAVLVADMDDGASNLIIVATGEQLPEENEQSAEEKGSRRVIHRFVLPVERSY